MPNSPSESAVVGAELDLRAGDQRQALAARVLEQVAGQLVDDLVLDALVALAIVGRQPDGVLVGDVGARNRHGAVLVHLLGQLVRDLDRAHLGLEDAAERALDEAGDAILEVAQHAHRWSTPLAAPRSGAGGHGRRGSDGRAARRAARRPTAATAPTTRRGDQTACIQPAARAETPSSIASVATASAIDHAAAAARSSAALRPRTTQGSRTAASAHSAATASSARREHRHDRMVEGGAGGLLPAHARPHAVRRAGQQPVAGEQLGQLEPEQPERAERRAARRGGGLAGERGKRAREAERAERRPAAGDRPERAGQRQRERDGDQRRRRGPPRCR